MTENPEISSIFDFANDRESLLGLIEALALASPTPITKDAIADILAQNEISLDEEEILSAMDELRTRYQGERQEKSGIEIAQIAGGIAFRTKSRYASFVRTLFKEKPQKLSSSQLEVLSIISYRQPVTRGEIEDIRGVDCSGSMRRLLNVKLIKILGKSQAVGRPLLYGTTKEFLEFFGLNSLHDLPTLREYQELNKPDSAEEIKANLNAESLKVLDLFEGHESAKEHYEEREKQSKEALESLDKALHRVANVAEKLENHPSTN